MQRLIVVTTLALGLAFTSIPTNAVDLSENCKNKNQFPGDGRGFLSRPSVYTNLYGSRQYGPRQTEFECKEIPMVPMLQRAKPIPATPVVSPYRRK